MANANRIKIGKEVMTELTRNIGNTVTVEYVSYGNVGRYTAELESVDLFGAIKLKGVSIPFIGYDCAIRTISVDGKTIYDNSDNIPITYNPKVTEVEEYRERSFGSEIARQIIGQQMRHGWQVDRAAFTREEALLALRNMHEDPGLGHPKERVLAKLREILFFHEGERDHGIDRFTALASDRDISAELQARIVLRAIARITTYAQNRGDQAVGIASSYVDGGIVTREDAKDAILRGLTILADRGELENAAFVSIAATSLGITLQDVARI